MVDFGSLDLNPACLFHVVCWLSRPQDKMVRWSVAMFSSIQSYPTILFGICIYLSDAPHASAHRKKEREYICRGHLNLVPMRDSHLSRGVLIGSCRSKSPHRSRFCLGALGLSATIKIRCHPSSDCFAIIYTNLDTIYPHTKVPQTCLAEAWYMRRNLRLSAGIMIYKNQASFPGRIAAHTIEEIILT